MKTSLLLLVLSFVTFNALAKVKLIHAGTLLANASEPAKKQQTIIITDGKISRVESGYITSVDGDASPTIIDLKEYFVLPGLMDMHVHLQGQLGPTNDRDALKMSNQLVQMRSQMYAMNTLKAGFTTVRDVGSRPQEMYAMRDAINMEWIDGPRIIAAGGVGITGGHGDVSGVSHELMTFYDQSNKQVCDGPYECRRAARHAIKYGADLIKITSTGGVMTDRETGTGQQMEMDELKEIVQAAERMGKKVASHAHQEEGIVAALKAGVHSIEHGTYTSDKAIKLFKQTGAYLVPTLLAGDTVVQMAKNTDILTESQKAKALKVGEAMQGNFEKAHKAGVKIAFGTDSGISKHGANAQEALLMYKAGMSEMDIIKSATINAADLIGMSNQLGSIEAGKHADIIATKTSPIDNIEALLDVAFVMKSGKVYKD